MGYEEDKESINGRLDKIDTMSESLAKIISQVDGQEELTQKWKKEVGDLREEIKNLEESGLDAESLKKLVDKVDALGDNKNRSSKDDTKGGADSDGDWDEKQLTPAAQAKADEVYSQLTPEGKADIANNPSKREEFLKAAQEATEEVPESLFKKPAEKKSTVNEFRNLFGLISKDANHVPGSSSGTSSYKGASQRIASTEGTQVSKRLPGGSIPRGGDAAQ